MTHTDEDKQEAHTPETPNEVDKNPKPLVDWKTAPKLSELKLNLEGAMPSHDYAMGIIAEWLDYYHVRGKAAVVKRHNRSAVQPRLVRKQVEWRVPSLMEPFLSTPDLYNVEPVSAEDKASSLQNGLLLNNQFNTKLNKTKFIQEYVRTVSMEGTVIIKSGWLREVVLEDVEKTTYIYREVQNDGEAQLVQELIQYQQSDPIMFTQEVDEEVAVTVQMSQEQQKLIIAVPTGTKTVKEEKIIKNQPTAEVCRNQDVILDPSSEGDLDKAQFVIYRFTTSLSDLKKDGRYKNLDNIKFLTQDEVEDNSYTDSMGRMGDTEFLTEAGRRLNRDNGDEAHQQSLDGFTFSDKARRKMDAYEYWGYWDIDNSGMTKPILVTWIGDTIIRMEESPFPDADLPFIKETYLPVLHQNYGEPDAALLKENQDISGAVLRGILDLMGRSSNSQKGVAKGHLDFINKRKYDNFQDYEYNPTSDPKSKMIEHSYPEIPRSAIELLGMQTQEAEGLTGVKSFSQGIGSASLGKVATGIRGALDAASKRELSILRGLAQGIVKLGHKIIAMNAEFLSEEEVIRVTHKQFVKVRRKDLAGNFDLSLSISTAEEDDAKAQELAFMLQTGAASADPGEVRMIRAEIARLRKMPALAKQIEEYQPEPDPIEDAKRQAEVELIQAQVAEVKTKTREHEALAMLNEAKAEVERTKADLFKSEKDIKDLDYLEQEKGVKQAREIEKTGLQHAHESNKQDKDISAKLTIEQNKADQAKAKEANKPKPTKGK
jgi:hypothetical protein